MTQSPAIPRRRIERFHAGNITPEMTALYTETVTRVRARRDASPAMKALLDDEGRLNGPPSLWLLSPGVGKGFEQMQGLIRNHMRLSPRHMELVVLMVGGHCDSEFEIFAHRLAAPAVGISVADVEALLAGGEPSFDQPGDEAVFRVTQTLLRERRLSDEAYAGAVRDLGVHQLFEITVVVGFYEAIALQLEVFNVRSE